MSAHHHDGASRYSLWLMPERGSSQFGLLHDAITGLARQWHFPGDVRAPEFIPHVTLLPMLHGMSVEEIKERTRQVARTISSGSIRINMEGLGKGSTFHQCVFVTVKKTPEVLCSLLSALLSAFPTLYPSSHPTGLPQLLEAFVQGQQAMGLVPTPDSYMPHISLVYADIPDLTKDEIIRHIQVPSHDPLPLLSRSLTTTPSFSSGPALAA